MDHFEIDADMTEEERHRMGRALDILKGATLVVAKAFDMCPICLTYALADLTSDAEEAGLVRHGNEGGTEH